MIKRIICFSISILIIFTVTCSAQTISISFSDAVSILLKNNDAIHISEKVYEIAKAESGKLNASWYPFLTASGEFIHMSNDISVKENIAKLAQPFQDAVPELNAIAEQLLPALDKMFPDIDISKIIGEAVGKIGGMDFVFPILKQNVSSINATITWPLFTGGKRIYASRIGKSLTGAAYNLQGLTINTQIALLAASYYGLKLADEIVKVQKENYKAMSMLYNNANKMMNEGILNKADMLVAKTSMEEAKREYESACLNRSVVQKTLLTLINIKECSEYDSIGKTNITNPPVRADSCNLASDFFMLAKLPTIDEFKSRIDENSHQLKIMDNQINVAANEKKIAVSGYMPDIAIFGRQNLYAYQAPKNLFPRTIIGAGFVWNLFDGLGREKSIRVAKKEGEQLQIQKAKAQSDLYLLADQLYSQITDAENNIKSLKVSQDLGKELIRVREKSFAEGMATTFDIVYARSLYTKINLAVSAAYYSYDISLANLMSICGDSMNFVNCATHNCQ